MFEVQETLEAQKREFNRKEEVFKRREDGLKKKDLELQESLVRFSKFLQENDSKRTRSVGIHLSTRELAPCSCCCCR